MPDACLLPDFTRLPLLCSRARASVLLTDLVHFFSSPVQPCDDYQFKDKVYNRQADEIASNTYDFSLECCQCEFTYEPPHEPEEPTRPPLPPLPPRKPKMPPSPNRPPRPPDPPRPVSRRRPRHW